MGVVKTILLVAFVIVCVLLVLLVLVQNEDGNGMGSAFGGGNNAAFGAHSGSVLTKATGVLVAMFFVITFVLALLNKNPVKEDLSGTAAELQATTEESTGSANWLETELGSESTESTVEAAE